MISISNPIRKLRTRIAKVVNTSYLAESDGVVNVKKINAPDTDADMRGLTDGANPPTTVMACCSAIVAQLTDMSIEMTVIKGDYWKVTATSPDNIWWLPEK